MASQVLSLYTIPASSSYPLGPGVLQGPSLSDFPKHCACLSVSCIGGLGSSTGSVGTWVQGPQPQEGWHHLWEWIACLGGFPVCGSQSA